MDELKPCPFCGERLFGCSKDPRYSHWHKHPENGCILSDVSEGGYPLQISINDKSDVQKWNRRADHEPNN